MIRSCRMALVGPSVSVLLISITACARDGSLEPRGSLKDPPQAGYSQPNYPRTAAASVAPVTQVARAPSERAAPERVAMTEAPPAARPVAPPITQPTIQPVTPPPARTSSAQPLTAPIQPRTTPPPAAERKPSGSQLLEEGRSLFRSGEVLAARERYVAALNAPLPEVLLELARTYDPNYLAKLAKADADADVERARALYEQSMTLGSQAAQADLARLPTAIKAR